IVDIKTGHNIKAEKVSFSAMNLLQKSIDILAKKLVGLSDTENSTVTDTKIPEEQEINTISAKAEKIYFYQLSMGSSYSFYPFDIQKVLDTMDAGSISRIPFNIDLLFGKKISPTTAWTGTLNSGIDSFSDSSDSFTIYTILLAAGVQYIPFQKGLTLGLGIGGSIMIPNTTLSYIGDIEFGSTVSFDIGYYFETLKFSKAGIIPGLGLKYLHSEMLRGSVDQISGYITLGIR
ncbi:MAG: hypothetical protein U9N32_01935, partial [Spirochaetota bacterium]|nr:hypothetical protein [Spirochaetota bacterium]